MRLHLLCYPYSKVKFFETLTVMTPRFDMFSYFIFLDWLLTN